MTRYPIIRTVRRNQPEGNKWIRKNNLPYNTYGKLESNSSSWNLGKLMLWIAGPVAAAVAYKRNKNSCIIPPKGA